MSALRRTPGIVRYAFARFSIAQSWAQFAMTVDDPIQATRVFCGELRRATRGHGVVHWAQTRRLLGGIWIELGGSLVAAGQHKPAGRAAAQALLQNPLLLGRKSLPRLITQAGMGALRRARTKSPTS